MGTSQSRHIHEFLPHIMVTNRLSSCAVVSHTSFCYTPIDQTRLNWLFFPYFEEKYVSITAFQTKVSPPMSTR